MTEIEKIFYIRLALQEEYGGNEKPVNKIHPLASIVVTTYQHALYIRQCLDSILLQETDFPYEIIIGEDGSTDGTREICIEYAKKYPDKIRLFLRDRSLSHYIDSQGNDFIFNVFFCTENARGKYIAICEGDDYWINKKKLSLQVKIMENNLEIGLVHSEFHILNEIKNYLYQKYHHSVGLSKIEWNSKNFWQLYGGKYNTIKTVTVCIRSYLLRDYLKKIYFDTDFPRGIIGDFPLFFYCSNRLKIAYLNSATSVYRINKYSATNINNKYYMYKEIERYKRYFINKFQIEDYVYIRSYKRNLLEMLEKLYLDRLNPPLNEVAEYSRFLKQKKIYSIYYKILIFKKKYFLVVKAISVKFKIRRIYFILANPKYFINRILLIIEQRLKIIS